jgi:phytoene synthase
MNETLAQVVRRHDPDRFLTTLFAPSDRRDTLLTLYAFNHELARARAVVSEPTLALIRLQWWREVVQGQPKRHEIATPLTEALERGALKRDDLLALVDARDAEAYGEFAITDEWRAWLMQGSGGLAVAAGRALGVPQPEVLRHYGAAYGIAALLRATGGLASHGRCLLPHDLLASHGLSPEAFIHDPGSIAGRAVLAHIVHIGRGVLRSAVGVPRRGFAAALPAVLARRDFAAWPRLSERRGFGDRLAVVRAAMLGRI